MVATYRELRCRASIPHLPAIQVGGRVRRGHGAEIALHRSMRRDFRRDLGLDLAPERISGGGGLSSAGTLR